MLPKLYLERKGKSFSVLGKCSWSVPLGEWFLFCYQIKSQRDFNGSFFIYFIYIVFFSMLFCKEIHARSVCDTKLK